MIDVIIGLFTGIKNLLYYGLLLSYEIGKFIFKLVQFAWCVFRYLYDIFQIVTTVICEDFIIFLHDIYDYITCILQFVNNLVGNTFYVTAVGVGHVKYYISLGKEILLTSISNVIYGNLKFLGLVGQLFIGIKHFFILLGSGVWFLLTLIPLGIIYSFSLCMYYIGNCIEELINIICTIFRPMLKFAQDIIDFTFDVPFEATAGLIVGGCVLYALVKCHMIAYRFLKKQIVFLTRCIRLTLRNSVRNKYFQFQRTAAQIIPPNRNSHANNDIHCVVCQEREKCILILPCKHVCLCSECKDLLHRYHSRCPVCRSYVQKTMKVFI